MLACMNNERRKLSFTPLHCFYNRGDLPDVWSRADNIDYFEPGGESSVHSLNSIVRLLILTLDFGHWTLDLQTNYPRAAIASDVAVKRIPRIHYQRTKLAHSLVVSLAMVGDNYHAVAGAQFFVG